MKSCSRIRITVLAALLGSLASAAISNLYYPSQDRRGVGLTFENTAIGLAGAAAGNVAQELLFLTPLDSHLPDYKRSFTSMCATMKRADC